MDQNLKNLLSVALTVALLVGSYSSLRYVSEYGKSIQPSSFRSFSVSAEGKVVAIPDIATFTFSVITEGGKDIGKLQTENTSKMNSAIAFIKSKGIEDKDISTQNYEINPRYDYRPCDKSSCPPPEINGYTVNQTAFVKIRKFDLVSEVLTGVVKGGANSVSQLQFTIDDPTELRAAAQKVALEKAKDKAERLAKDAGFTLGRLLEVSESNQYQPPFPYLKTNYDMAMGMGGGGEVGPAIQPGSQELVVTMSLKYEID